MKNTSEIIGFHGTENDCAYKIIEENRFYISCKSNEWLGKGIYFWANYNDSLWWIDNLKILNGSSILKVLLVADSADIVDLSNDNEMEKFEKFVDEFNKTMIKEDSDSMNFKKVHQLKNFYCSLYKATKNIRIMAYNFEYPRYNKAGFKVGNIKRRQICATDNSVISNIELIWQGGAT